MFTSDRIRYHTVSVSPIFLSTHTPVVGDHSSIPPLSVTVKESPELTKCSSVTCCVISVL